MTMTPDELEQYFDELAAEFDQHRRLSLERDIKACRKLLSVLSSEADKMELLQLIQDMEDSYRATL